MNSFLLRSNSSHHPNRPVRGTTPSQARPAAGGRPLTHGAPIPSKVLPSSTYSATAIATGAPSSPVDSTRPPRPKSTLGFSSKFALSWKNSLKSSTSARSALTKAATASSPSSAISNKAEDSEIRASGDKIPGERVGGIRGLRRKVSSEWWARPATPAALVRVPTIPTTPTPRALAKSTGPRILSTPSPARQLSPFVPVTRSAATTPTKPLGTRVPLPLASPLTSSARKVEAEDHRMRAVHAEWRAAARGMEGDARQCLMGAVCISITDPLEGIKEEHMNAFAPRRPAIRLLPPRTLTPSSSARPLKSPTRSITRPTAPTAATTRPSRAPVTVSTSTSPIPSPSPTPRSLSRPKPCPSPTPLTRRPLASRRTIDATAPLTPRQGVTPRSARRMRNSLKMTPLPGGTGGGHLQPVAYIPLKSPAASPRTSRIVQDDGGEMRKVSGGSSSSSGGEGTVTPPMGQEAGQEEVGSPWQVVRPPKDADWVVTSPIKRSIR